MRHHTTLLLFAALVLIWLWHAFGGNPAFDLVGTLGSSLQKLALLSLWIALVIVAFRTFEHGRDQLSLPGVFFQGACILAGALCLVN